eukprot:675491-Pleurochrysis_carterae.AAC.1
MDSVSEKPGTGAGRPAVRTGSCAPRHALKPSICDTARIELKRGSSMRARVKVELRVRERVESTA